MSATTATPPMGDCQEKEDQEESNVASRRDRQDMQMMKKKMDMMMNTMRGHQLGRTSPSD